MRISICYRKYVVYVCVFVCVYDVMQFLVYFDSVFVSQEKKRKKNERWVK